jgi:putative Mn2+ efflux pump MntP
MAENAEKPPVASQNREAIPVANSIAGGVVCIGLACIALWNEVQRYPHPIRLGDLPSIAGRQVAAIALCFVGVFLIWNAFKARRHV